MFRGFNERQRYSGTKHSYPKEEPKYGTVSVTLFEYICFCKISVHIMDYICCTNQTGLR